ncbi:hypothetical protein F2Q69_00049973 [Brassica cretica]|uniref:Uncharacterized protein n=1 Tax=Brassica cretica TaxID=69181 RepID=A0A8S9PV21_BRACR|nr:hypothetical protein F2Q69_00049973 [Brassica cretica]
MIAQYECDQEKEAKKSRPERDKWKKPLSKEGGRTRDCKCSPGCPKEAGDVVDSGPEADHEKDLTTAYASGDILGSFSCDKLVQPFVCKEYDPVKLLRHE